MGLISFFRLEFKLKSLVWYHVLCVGARLGFPGLQPGEKDSGGKQNDKGRPKHYWEAGTPRDSERA